MDTSNGPSSLDPNDLKAPSEDMDNDGKILFQMPT